MFKKTIIVGAVMAASTGLAFANGGTFTPPTASSHSGRFYIGAAASHDTTSIDIEQNFYHINSTEQEQESIRRDIFSHNLGWEIFAGSGITFNNHYYIGAEIFGAKGNPNSKSSRILTFTVLSNSDTVFSRKESSFTSVNIKDSYGATLVPGLMLNNNSLLYGKIGWTRSKFELRYGGINLLNLGVPTSYVKKDVNGLQLGIGLETMLTNCFSIRGEYDWNRYNTINNSSKKTLSGSLRHNSLKANHPQVTRFALAGILRFGGNDIYSEPHTNTALHADHMSGFYLGASAGRSLANYNYTAYAKEFYFENLDPQTDSTTNITTHNQKRKLGRHSWNASIFGGYGKTLHNIYYLGAEGFVSADTSDLKHTTVGTLSFTLPHFNQIISSHEHAQINLKHSYGLALIPGTMITPNTMLYGRIGWVNSRFELLFLRSRDLIGSSEAPAEVNFKKTKNGIQLGIGLEIRTKNNISLRAEYDWTKYRGSLSGTGIYKQSLNFGNSIEFSDSLATVKLKGPEVTRFSIAAVYHFVS